VAADRTFRPKLEQSHWIRVSITAHPSLGMPLRHDIWEDAMIGTILLIILILLLLGAVPTWPHSRGWGYGPSGILGVLAIVLIVLLLMGRI